MANRTKKSFTDKIEIFEKLHFPQIKRRREAMSVVCKKAGKVVARFPSVDSAAEYIAPRANFSEKYVRNSIYKAIRQKEMFPPFSDYFWEEEAKSAGTFIVFDPADLKKKTPFLKEDERHLKAAESQKPLK